MRKITDEGYSLPMVEALSLHATLETGANKPLLIRGVDAEGALGDYVLKLRGAERMSTEASMRELLAAFIAAQMGIRAVDPVIITISKEFTDLLTGTTRTYAGKSLGYNYGSEYLEKYVTIIPTKDLNSYQLPYAQTIFAFDVTIQNPDRTLLKPNMLTDGTEIVILDHELAFSFALDISPNPRPWEIRNVDLEWINRHCLLSKISGKDFDFEVFSGRFDNLDADFWTTARGLIPNEWLSDQFDKIKQHFDAIRANKDTFIMELKKLMS